jgi:protein SCO1/2
VSDLTARLTTPLAALAVGFVLAASAARDEPLWHKAYFPNVELTTQDGKIVRFYDDVIMGKVVAINFIYTKCPDVCPMDTAALRRVQKLVGARMGRDVFFYSISLDPKNDTPAAMRSYMRTFDVGPGWTFLTGRPQDIALIQRKFGVRPVKPGALSAHDTRYVMGNEAIARWIKRTPHDNPHVLAHILTRDLPGPGMARDNSPRRSYAEAKNIEGMTPGASLFMTRCSACHSIGGQDGKLGPDLAGVVERRPRAWLRRMIKEPDRLRAEKDAVAIALLAKYRGVPMPNLRLSDDDVTQVVEFIAQDTKRFRASLARPKQPAAVHHNHRN